MKAKILELKGTIVSIEDTQKCPEVKVTTEDADIYVNGILVWSRYEKEEYAHIPPIMRAFVDNHNEYICFKDGMVTTDICVNGTNIEMYIPQNTRKAIVARFDLINNVDELESEYVRNSTLINDKTADKIMEDIKTLWNELESTIISYGYKFGFSHSMNDGCWGWWDVSFKVKDWNEDNIKKISTMVANFNKIINGLFDKYSL